MFNPSKEWKEKFSELSEESRRGVLGRMSEDWGLAMEAVGEQFRERAVRVQMTDTSGFSIPGVPLESLVDTVYRAVRKSRYQHSQISEMDYDLLEIEVKESGF